MLAQCHSSIADIGGPTDGPRGAANRVADEVLLSAALDCVLAVGVRRTTLTEVARRAGVSRMTVYRRFPDVRSLLAELLTREFGTVLGQAASQGAHRATHARGRLVCTAVNAARLLADSPLLGTVLDIDPELLLPYLTERVGSTQRLAEQFIREHIVAGQRDDSIRAGDIAYQARVFFLTVQAAVISLRPATRDLDRDTLLGELATQLDAGLRVAG